MSLFNPDDYVAMLAAPEVGLPVAALTIATLSASFFPKIKADWIGGSKLKGVSFVAELLTAIGIVGLITFVGRARLDHLDFEAAVSQANARSALAEKNQRFLAESCSAFPDRSPTILNSKHESACNFAASFDREMSPDRYWSGFQADLLEFEGTNLSTDSSKALIARITDFEVARGAQSRAQGEKQLLAYDGPWKSLLVCFLLAALGISLKCVRAFVEWRIPQPEVKKFCEP